MIEGWRRIDSRISYQDILDRQRCDPDYGGIGLKKSTPNALQNHCRRACRKILNNWVEYGRRDESHRTEVEAIEELNYDNIVNNTVLNESADFPGRLVKIRFQRLLDDGLWHAEKMEVTEANIRETTYDVNHFCGSALPGISETNLMTKCMIAAWEMSMLLQERAGVHGKQHWSKLDKQCLPTSWFDRLQKNQRTVANVTFDGGCAVCTWTEGREDSVVLAMQKQKQRAVSTLRKRGRATSSSNSDVPLMKKHKKARVAKDDKESDQEEARDDALEEETASRPAFRTSVPPRRAVRFAEEKEDYEAQGEDYDEDATESMLSSEVRMAFKSLQRDLILTDLQRDSIWSSGGGYRHSRSRLNGPESPLAPYSNQPLHLDDMLDSLEYAHGPALHRPQPFWDEVGIASSPPGQSDDFPYLSQDPGSESMKDLESVEHRQISFNSTEPQHGQSFSSEDMYSGTTIATSFGSEGDLAYGLQQVNARMQHPLADSLSHDHPHLMFRPGRMTMQGGELSNIFTSPLRPSYDLGNTSWEYQPPNFLADARRHSFGDFPGANESLPQYGQNVDSKGNAGDFSFTGSHLLLEDTDRAVDGDYDLPNALPMSSSARPTSRNPSFQDLLSSDPFENDDYQMYIDPNLSDENSLQEAQPESEAVGEDETTRPIRQTPPMLDD
jgi:hypothetical protein